MLGDLDEGFTYSLLNKILYLLDKGAQLISFHQNLYMLTESGRVLDSGAFSLVLQHLTGQQAIVMGKPSKQFFESAVARFNQLASNTVFVGDDITTDIAGANRIGAVSVLVKSGKYRDGDLDNTATQPTYVIDSLPDLIERDILSPG